MKYGTYTTIDYPTSKETEAFDFLASKFKIIGGSVRLLNNSHDLGDYLSFEVDYPAELEDVEGDDGTKSYIKEEWLKKEEWIEKANEIEEEYYKKFSKYL